MESERRYNIKTRFSKNPCAFDQVMFSTMYMYVHTLNMYMCIHEKNSHGGAVPMHIHTCSLSPDASTRLPVPYANGLVIWGTNYPGVLLHNVKINKNMYVYIQKHLHTHTCTYMYKKQLYMYIHCTCAVLYMLYTHVHTCTYIYNFW